METWKRARKLSNSMTRLNTGLEQFCTVLTNLSNSDSFDFDKIEENVEKTRHYLAKRIRNRSKNILSRKPAKLCSRIFLGHFWAADFPDAHIARQHTMLDGVLGPILRMIDIV